ncbi:MAG: hydrogenase maturation protease [Acidimicrobiales bacterium]
MNRAGTGTLDVLVTAVGSVWRRDDGAGPAVLDRLPDDFASAEVVGPLSTPFELLGLWDGARLAIVVDAIDARSEPGEVHAVELEMDASPEVDARPTPRTSSHGFGLVEVFRLARALGSAPARVVLVGVGGEDFGEGFGLSPATSRGVARAVRLVVDLAECGRRDSATRCRSRGPVPGPTV